MKYIEINIIHLYFTRIVHWLDLKQMQNTWLLSWSVKTWTNVPRDNESVISSSVQLHATVELKILCCIWYCLLLFIFQFARKIVNKCSSWCIILFWTIILLIFCLSYDYHKVENETLINMIYLGFLKKN